MEQSNGGGLFGLMFGLFFLLFFVALIAAMWRVYVKGGQPGWACLIPIYNIVALNQIIGLPIWTVLLYFVPFVNFIMVIYSMHRLAQAFGKDILYTLGLIFLGPVFWLLLGFGDAEYVGIDGSGGGSPGMNRF